MTARMAAVRISCDAELDLLVLGADVLGILVNADADADADASKYGGGERVWVECNKLEFWERSQASKAKQSPRSFSYFPILSFVSHKSNIQTQRKHF